MSGFWLTTPTMMLPLARLTKYAAQPSGLKVCPKTPTAVPEVPSASPRAPYEKPLVAFVNPMTPPPPWELVDVKFPRTPFPSGLIVWPFTPMTLPLFAPTKPRMALMGQLAQTSLIDACVCTNNPPGRSLVKICRGYCGVVQPMPTFPFGDWKMLEFPILWDPVNTGT